ncbi:MAG TPA: NAD(P)-dependent oxidoreductase [Mycobacterium sp.]|nr:NAD(P)-dependent oxidoreductase [Mycobacterium sp.]
MTEPDRLGFVGLGNMGFPIAERLLAAGHRVLAYDIRRDALDGLVAQGAEAAASATAVAESAETVLMSLPAPQAARMVATAVGAGTRVRRVVDLSTIGSSTARAIHAELASRGIGYVDSPVSGGAAGARAGTLAVMMSGSDDDVDAVLPVIETFGRPIRLGTRPGAAQTMKLLNNLLAGSALAITAEAMVMGVKSGLDAPTMIEVFNAGSGANTATRDKFPRAVLPRTFDYGFAAALMAKDLRLCLDEARELGLTLPLGDAVLRVWEDTAAALGPEADFTAVIRPIEDAAGVTVEG